MAYRSSEVAAINSGTSLVINTPAGVVEGDVLVAGISVDNQTLSLPTGWANVTGSPQTGTIGAGNVRRLYVATRTVTASEPANHTFTLGGSQEAAGGISAFSGRKPTVNAVNGNASGASGTTIATGSIAPTVDDCDVITVFGTDATNATAPTNWTIDGSATMRFVEDDSSTFMTTGLFSETQTLAASVSHTGTCETSAARMAVILALAPEDVPTPSMDDVRVEIAFVTDDGAMVFDDGDVGFDEGVFDGNLVWEDVTQYVRSVSIKRGMNSFEGIYARAQAGTATVVLDNSDARFDPTNPDSPYVGLIYPMVQFRFRVERPEGDIYLWRGYADAWDLEYPELNHDAICTLTGTDGIKVLAAFNGTAQATQGSGEDSGARITRILDNAVWPADLRDIATGIIPMQSTNLAQNAWGEMTLTSDSETGELYIDGEGKVVFRNILDIFTEARSTTPQAVFADRPFGLGLSIFEDSFTYANGGLSTVGSAKWNGPVRTAGTTLEVTSNQVGGAVNDGNYSLGYTYGDGDYGVKVATSGVYAFYINGKYDTEAGIDGYGILSFGTSIFLYRFDNTVGTLLGTTAITTAAGDIFGIRKVGSNLKVYQVKADGTTTVLLEANDATYSTGRIMLEVFDTTVRLDDVFYREVELGYIDVKYTYDDSQIANLVRIGRANGSQQTAEDGDSQVRYGVQTYERSDLIFTSDAYSQAVAEFVLFIMKDAQLRFSNLVVNPLADPANLFPQVWARDFGDRIRIIFGPKGRTDALERDVYIRGISHTWNPNAQWITSWVLQDASKFDEWAIQEDI